MVYPSVPIIASDISNHISQEKFPIAIIAVGIDFVG